MAEPITSLQNAQVKRLVRLRTRRAREDEGVMLVEGARELARAVAAGLRPEVVYSCSARHSPEALEVVTSLHAPLQPLSEAAFDKVSGREHPDGLLAVFPAPAPALGAPGPDAFVIVLHGLEKPGNLGAILRSADAAGAHAALVLGRGADPYSPGVIRASQGSVFSLPVVALEEEEALAWLAAHGFSTVACTPEAPRAYWDAPLTGRVALLLGTEHDGLPERWRRSDRAVSIPMPGARGADSLNVATAAALILFECVRQRRGAP